MSKDIDDLSSQENKDIEELDPQEIMAKIDWEQATEVKCKKCESPLFKSRFGIRHLNKEDTPTGTDMIIPIRLFVCSTCDHIDPDLQVTVPQKKGDNNE